MPVPRRPVDGVPLIGEPSTRGATFAWAADLQQATSQAIRPAGRFMRPNPVRQSPAITACLLTILLGAMPTAQSRDSAPTSAPAGIAWLILVDDLHVDFRNTGLIQDLLRSMSVALMGDGDVVVMRTTRPSSVAIGPTSDRVIIKTAIRIGPTSDRVIIETAIRSVVGSGLWPLEDSDPAGEKEARRDLALSEASTLLDSVPSVPDRRRVMLYISNGYESEPSRALASLFAHAAQQANVIIFAVNANGVPGSVVLDSRGDAELWKQVVASRRQSLQVIADGTGGFALLDPADFADATSRIRAAVLMRR